MKGYVSHLVTENEKLEQELTADYDAAHAPVICNTFFQKS